jgi:hypothetical protein
VKFAVIDSCPVLAGNLLMLLVAGWLLAAFFWLADWLLLLNWVFGVLPRVDTYIHTYK